MNNKKINNAKSKRYYVNNKLRLRRTQYGGTVFLPSQALTVELDTQAFELLTWQNGVDDLISHRYQACNTFECNFTLAEVDKILQQFEEMGLVYQEKNAAHSIKQIPKVISNSNAPECVHIQLTNNCNKKCLSCYMPFQEQINSDLQPARLITLIDEFSELGVFQIAIGGGEPLMSPNLLPLIRHASKCGILPNITTNGSLITERFLNDAADYIGEIRLSLNENETILLPRIEQLVHQIKNAGINFGFNLIVTRQNITELWDILQSLSKLKPSSIVLLRPKPGPSNNEWYALNSLGVGECRYLADILKKLENEMYIDGLALDCAFSFLFYNMKGDALQWRGVKGCSGGIRFCVIKSNGDVYPCSHLNNNSFFMGNVKDLSFNDIILSNLKSMDETNEIGECTTCNHNQTCRGCRAIACFENGDYRANDPACPVLN